MLRPYFMKGVVEAGCDEAGRGCLAGPVFAAAVVFPAGYVNNILNDSKLLSPGLRNELKDMILRDALSFGIGMADNREIDAINILKASFLAMHRAISALTVRPELLLIDGNRFNPYPGIKHHCLVKGDSLFISIAAASILAKTARDEFMQQQDILYPYYNWKRNKGYPTVEHRKAIAEYGISPLHRRSFSMQQKLF